MVKRALGYYWTGADHNGDVWSMRWDGKMFWSHQNSFHPLELDDVSDEPITRTPGQYWVRKGDVWFVAEFSEMREWLLNNERMPTRKNWVPFESVGDCYFDEIDEAACEHH